MKFTDDIVKQHKRMVGKLANGYVDKYLSKSSASLRNLLREDLEQEGYIGLAFACDQYIEAKGTLFSTYAYSRIWARMQQYMNYKHNLVHVPIKEAATGHKVSYYHIDDASECCLEKLGLITDEGNAELYEELYLGLGVLDKTTANVLIDNACYGSSVSCIAREYGLTRREVERMIKDGLKQIKQILEGK